MWITWGSSCTFWWVWPTSWLDPYWVPQSEWVLWTQSLPWNKREAMDVYWTAWCTHYRHSTTSWIPQGWGNREVAYCWGDIWFWCNWCQVVDPHLIPLVLEIRSCGQVPNAYHLLLSSMISSPDGLPASLLISLGEHWMVSVIIMVVWHNFCLTLSFIFAKSNSSYTFIDSTFPLILSIHVTSILSYPSFHVHHPTFFIFLQKVLIYSTISTKTKGNN